MLDRLCHSPLSFPPPALPPCHLLLLAASLLACEAVTSMLQIEKNQLNVDPNQDSCYTLAQMLAC